MRVFGSLPLFIAWTNLHKSFECAGMRRECRDFYQKQGCSTIVGKEEIGCHASMWTDDDSC